MLGNNGIVTKAKQAKQETLQVQARENLELMLGEIKVRIITEEERQTIATDCDELEGKDGISAIQYEEQQEKQYALVTYQNYEFRIDENLTIMDQYTNFDGVDNSTRQQEKEALVLLEHFNENSVLANENVEMDSNLLNMEQKKMGNASLYLNDTTVYDNNQDEFDFAGDFTIDFWLYTVNIQPNGPASLLVVDKPGGMWIGFDNGKFVVHAHSSAAPYYFEHPAIKTWNHIAICRENGMIYVFYNGVLQGSFEYSAHFEKARMCIGTDNYSNFMKESYIDELRILKGEAKWTSNFTVPNKEYTSQDGYVQHFNYHKVKEDTAELSKTEKKFGTASKYFNHTGMIYTSKNQEDFNLVSDFTIDFWIKLSAENLTTEVATMVSYPGLFMGLHNGKFEIQSATLAGIVILEPPTTGKWTHIAICRKEGVLYVFYDGKLQGTGAYAPAFTGDGTLYVGKDTRGDYLKDTYIDELRVLNGFAKWTEEFNVPTREYYY